MNSNFGIGQLRPLRFSLKAIFAFVAIASILFFGIYWSVRSSNAEVAHTQYESALDALENESGLPLDVAKCSANWMTAALRVPFATRRTIVASHVYRIAALITRQERTFVNTNYGDGGISQREWIELIRHDYLNPAILELRKSGGTEYATRIESELKKSDPFIRSLPPP